MKRTDEIRAYVTNEARFFKRVDLSREDALYLLDRCDRLEDFIRCSIFNVHVSEEKQQEARALLAEES